MSRAWPRRRLLRHGLFWAVALGTSLLIQLPAHFAINKPLYVWGLLLNQLPASLLATYALLYGLLPRLLRGQLGRFLLGLAGWLPATVLLSNCTRLFYDFVLAPGLLGIQPNRAFQWADFWLMSYTWFLLMVMAGGAAAVKVMHGWYAQQQLSQHLEQRRLHTELQLLKAQLQPAFLFGTLRTLQQLTARQSPDSPAAVLHLAGLLRYMLYDSPHDAVPLADEVDMLRHYVALEQLRLGSGVEVSLSVSGALGAHTVAPLLLLPLVENAFKHGSTAGVECPWVSIDVVAKKSAVVLKVLNSHAAGAETNFAEGPHLHRLRQRLARLYPDRHELKLQAEPDTFFAALHLAAASDSVPKAATDVARPAALVH